MSELNWPSSATEIHVSPADPVVASFICSNEAGADEGREARTPPCGKRNWISVPSVAFLMDDVFTTCAHCGIAAKIKPRPSRMSRR
jgi:hypothetical protein